MLRVSGRGLFPLFPEHQLYSVLIAYSYRKTGNKALIEAKIGNKRTDVLIISENGKTAIEVELDKTIYIQDKIELLNHVDKLMIITREGEAEETKTIVETLPQEVKEKIAIYTITELLRNLNVNAIAKKSGKNLDKRNKSFSTSELRNKLGNGGK